MITQIKTTTQNDNKHTLIKRGQIWYVNFTFKAEGKYSLQMGLRPGICISNNLCNLHSSILHFIPLSTNVTKAKEKNMPTHIIINRSNLNGLKYDSVALCEQVMPVPRDYIDIDFKKIGIVDENVMLLLEKAMKVQLDLENKKVFDFEHIQYLLKMINESEKSPTTKKYLKNQLQNYCNDFNINPDSFISNIKSYYNNRNKPTTQEILLAN